MLLEREQQEFPEHRCPTCGKIYPSASAAAQHEHICSRQDQNTTLPTSRERTHGQE